MLIYFYRNFIFLKKINLLTLKFLNVYIQLKNINK
jgi:hypothetical protein